MVHTRYSRKLLIVLLCFFALPARSFEPVAAKHGMVVSGHATESLPQIALDLRGDEIYAVGVMGLMYGYSVNPAGT